MKFRKKPVVIEAYQWDGKTFNETTIQWIPDSDMSHWRCCNKGVEYHAIIRTLEGNMIVCPGDFIITGIEGEKYPCKPDIFAATYEKVKP